MHGGWEVDLAHRKLFQVRGLSTFRSTFSREATQLAPYIPAMRERLKDLGGWGIPQLDWNEDFSPRQIYAAYGRNAISLDKAAQVILLAVIAAEDRYVKTGEGMDGEAVLKLLAIEPQVYYVSGFRDDVVDTLRKNDKDGLRQLRAYCTQTNNEVFYVLANKPRKSRITLKLACAIKQFVETQMGLELGEVTSDPKGNPTANDNENIDFLPPQEVQEIVDGMTGVPMADVIASRTLKASNGAEKGTAPADLNGAAHDEETPKDDREGPEASDPDDGAPAS